MINSRELDDLRPEVQPKCKAFMDIAEIAGLDIFITSTYRDFEEQQKLYEEHKRSSTAPLAARPGYSQHNWRCAWDVAFRPVDDPKGATWIGDWQKLGQIAMILGIEWGGVWAGGKTDLCHFQFVSDDARADFALWEIEQQQPCARGNCG